MLNINNKEKYLMTPQIYSIDGVTPVIDPSSYVHPSAIIIGDVIIGPNCYVGPAASIRGDFGRLILEQGCNIQDTCVVHGFPDIDTVIEEDGHIGHGAVIHGCRIGKNVLIGMNAVIMDGAYIGDESIVAACSFVKAAFTCDPRSLVVGSPAKVLRQVSEKDVDWKSLGTRMYHDLTKRSLSTMELVEPLPAVEPNRKRIVFSQSIKPKHEI